MPTLTMEDEPSMDVPLDVTVQRGKHGRHKRYLLQNALVNHPVPSLEDGRCAIPKDAMPSVNKKWYNKLKGSFCMTVNYHVCSVRTPVKDFLLPDSNEPDRSHMLFSNLEENCEAYGNVIQNEVFMGTGTNGFVTYATQALNDSIRDLTESQPDADE